MYAPYSLSFEKHCVVIGPVDPTCFDAVSRMAKPVDGSPEVVVPGVPRWSRPQTGRGTGVREQLSVIKIAAVHRETNDQQHVMARGEESGVEFFSFWRDATTRKDINPLSSVA